MFGFGTKYTQMDPFALSVWVVASGVPSRQALCSPFPHSPRRIWRPLEGLSSPQNKEVASTVKNHWREFITLERKDKLCFLRQFSPSCLSTRVLFF